MRTRTWVLLFAFALAGASVAQEGPTKDESPAKQPPRRDGAPVVDEEASASRGYPVLKLERQGTAAEVIRTARKVQDEAKCDRCGGDGEVVEQKVVYPRSNPRSNVPFKEGTKVTQKKKCDKCEGASGLSAAKVFEVSMDNFTRALGAVKEDDPRLHEARDRAAKHLQEAMAEGRRRGAATVFAELTRRRTSDMPLKIGTPVYVVGFLMDDPVAAAGRPLRINSVSGISQFPSAVGLVLVSDPVISRAAKGERVIAGGLFAGSEKTGANATLPVVQGGWVVQLK